MPDKVLEGVARPGVRRAGRQSLQPCAGNGVQCARCAPGENDPAPLAPQFIQVRGAADRTAQRGQAVGRLQKCWRRSGLAPPRRRQGAADGQHRAHSRLWRHPRPRRLHHKHGERLGRRRAGTEAESDRFIDQAIDAQRDWARRRRRWRRRRWQARAVPRLRVVRGCPRRRLVCTRGCYLPSCAPVAAWCGCQESAFRTKTNF